MCSARSQSSVFHKKVCLQLTSESVETQIGTEELSDFFGYLLPHSFIVICSHFNGPYCGSCLSVYLSVCPVQAPISKNKSCRKTKIAARLKSCPTDLLHSTVCYGTD